MQHPLYPVLNKALSTLRCNGSSGSYTVAITEGSTLDQNVMKVPWMFSVSPKTLLQKLELSFDSCPSCGHPALKELAVGDCGHFFHQHCHIAPYLCFCLCLGSITTFIATKTHATFRLFPRGSNRGYDLYTKSFSFDLQYLLCHVFLAPLLESVATFCNIKPRQLKLRRVFFQPVRFLEAALSVELEDDDVSQCLARRCRKLCVIFPNLPLIYASKKTQGRAEAEIRLDKVLAELKGLQEQEEELQLLQAHLQGKRMEIERRTGRLQRETTQLEARHAQAMKQVRAAQATLRNMDDEAEKLVVKCGRLEQELLGSPFHIFLAQRLPGQSTEVLQRSSAATAGAQSDNLEFLLLTLRNTTQRLEQASGADEELMRLEKQHASNLQESKWLARRFAQEKRRLAVLKDKLDALCRSVPQESPASSLASEDLAATPLAPEDLAATPLPPEDLELTQNFDDLSQPPATQDSQGSEEVGATGKSKTLSRGDPRKKRDRQSSASSLLKKKRRQERELQMMRRQLQEDELAQRMEWKAHVEKQRKLELRAQLQRRRTEQESKSGIGASGSTLRDAVKCSLQKMHQKNANALDMSTAVVRYGAVQPRGMLKQSSFAGKRMQQASSRLVQVREANEREHRKRLLIHQLARTSLQQQEPEEMACEEAEASDQEDQEEWESSEAAIKDGTFNSISQPKKAVADKHSTKDSLSQSKKALEKKHSAKYPQAKKHIRTKKKPKKDQKQMSLSFFLTQK
eukprot:g4565.t1